MPEHRIRFRAGWELNYRGGGVDVARRFALPTSWPPAIRGPVRLARRFGRPPIDALGAARLELGRVPGLRRILLNGVEMGSPPPGASEWTVPLAAPLAIRNLLVLEVDPPVDDRPGGWGDVALIFGMDSGPSA